MTHAQILKLQAYEESLNALAKIHDMAGFRELNEERLRYVMGICKDSRH